jgi:hypothetical protein
MPSSRRGNNHVVANSAWAHPGLSFRALREMAPDFVGETVLKLSEDIARRRLTLICAQLLSRIAGPALKHRWRASLATKNMQS